MGIIFLFGKQRLHVVEELIDQIMEGKIAYEKGSLDFSVGEVSLSIQPGQVVEGSFTVYAPEGQMTEGFVNSSDSRMECLHTGFSGVQDEICYRFHGELMEADQTVSGHFRIVSNHGEYVIPFSVSTGEKYLESSLGNIRNLFHFVNLAKSNWDEALRIFYNPDFASILTGNDSQYLPLYKGMAGLGLEGFSDRSIPRSVWVKNKKPSASKFEDRAAFSALEDNDAGWKVDDRDATSMVDGKMDSATTRIPPALAHNMEAFLVNVGKKKPVELYTDISSVSIEDPIEDVRYQFAISRNGWGYSRTKIITEGDFLSVDAHDVTEDDFLGNVFPVYYYVSCDKLHEGKNFGAIHLAMDHKTQTIPVVVDVQRQRKHLKYISLEKQKLTKELMEYYKSFKIKKISKKIWMTETERIVNRMISTDEFDLSARLYKVQILVTQERLNEARWELDQMKVTLWDLKEEVPALWCYYLYLSSLLTNEERREQEIVEELTSYAGIFPDNWRIGYLLSCLAPEYATNPVRKYEFFEQLFNRGCHSPVIYLELASMLLQNPTLLHKLDAFELHTLNYMLSCNLLRAELRMQFISLADKEKNFNKLLLRILQGSYRENPQDDVLQLVCVQLIRDNRLDQEAHHWYDLAVRQELRITRLFEYYMLSLDLESVTTLPKTVQLYFSYHSDLDYQRNAFLYAYVTANRDRDPQMYERYGTQMSDFIPKQLLAGHITPYLAYLYTEYLTPERVTPELAEALAKMLFTKRICLKDKTIKRIVVAYAYNKKELSYPVKDGVAYVPVYISDYILIPEDGEGNRYVKWIPYEAEDMFQAESLSVQIGGLVKDAIGFDLYRCFKNQDYLFITEENEPSFRRLLQADLLTQDVKKDICMKLLEFYYDADKMEQLDLFLENLQVRMISGANRGKCLKYLIIRGFYEKAYEWLGVIGCEELEPRYLVRLCTELLERRMEAGVVEEPEDTLLQLMSQALSKGKYNEKMLLCMCTYFHGGLRQMRDLWNACKGFGIETRELEQRILYDLVYTGGYIAEKKDIFRSYMKSVPEPKLLAALLTQSCYEFFVKEKLMEVYLFEALPVILQENLKPDAVVAFAYLKYYGENPKEIGDRQKDYIRMFVNRLMIKGKNLTFCKDFVDLVPELAMFLDKTIVEYHTKPGNRVMIHYLIQQDEVDSNEYCTEPMEMVYAGVYEKSFVLFFGDTVQYYITEEEDGKAQLTESGTISKSDIGSERHDSRFELLNDVMIGKNLQDYDTVDKSLEEYYWKEFLVEKLFGERK